MLWNILSARIANRMKIYQKRVEIYLVTTPPIVGHDVMRASNSHMKANIKIFAGKSFGLNLKKMNIVYMDAILLERRAHY